MVWNDTVTGQTKKKHYNELIVPFELVSRQSCKIDAKTTKK